MVWTDLHLRGPARGHRETDPPEGLGSMLRLPLLSFCEGILQRRGGQQVERHPQAPGPTPSTARQPPRWSACELADQVRFSRIRGPQQGMPGNSCQSFPIV
jgi:hypothetical protein